jgi:hypothetical protein
MDFDDLVTLLPPAAKRVGKHTGEHEQHLYEGAVMVAYAMHLLRFEGAQEVEIHPDGMHGTQFDFTACLARRNFTMTTPTGRTAYGGIYADGAMSLHASATKLCSRRQRVASSIQGTVVRCPSCGVDCVRPSAFSCRWREPGGRLQ